MMVSKQSFRDAPDYDQILRVIQLYTEGWKGRADKFAEAFHEDAWILFTDSAGKIHKYLLAECFKSWAATNWDIEARIISLDQLGDIATVTMEFNNLGNPAASFVDIHNLLNVGGIGVYSALIFLPPKTYIHANKHEKIYAPTKS